MVEDLLSRIEQELYERIEELYPAVDECDRLQADLEALEAIPESPVEPEPPAEPPVESEPSVVPEPPAAPDINREPPVEPEPAAALNVDPDPAGTVLSFPANRKAMRTAALSLKAVRPVSTLSRPASVPANEPVVSPKVARLMLTPRRPALERSGIARVGAGV